MFFDFEHQPVSMKEPAPGFSVRPISGERLMLCDVTLQPRSESPMHTHSSEEMGIIIEGEFDMTIGEEKKLLKKGDIYLVPPLAVHGGVTHEKAVRMVSAFSPPRRDYT